MHNTIRLSNFEIICELFIIDKQFLINNLLNITFNLSPQAVEANSLLKEYEKKGKEWIFYYSRVSFTLFLNMKLWLVFNTQLVRIGLYVRYHRVTAQKTPLGSRASNNDHFRFS